MLKKSINITLTITLIFTLSGCIKTFIPNISTEKMPVIEGFISDYTDSIFLNIVWSHDPGDTSGYFEKIPDAQILLLEDNQIIDTFETQPQLPYYVCHYRAKQNKYYQIKCEIPNQPTIISQTYIPPPANITCKNVQVINTVSQYGEPIKYIIFTLKLIDNQPERRNYYSLVYVSRYLIALYINDPVVGYWDETDIGNRTKQKFLLFTDSLFSDSLIFKVRLGLYTDNPFIDTVSAKFYLLTLSKDAYRTLESFNNNIGHEIWDLPLVKMFSEPTVLYSNIQNGLGYFFGFSSDSTGTIKINVH